MDDKDRNKDYPKDSSEYEFGKETRIANRLWTGKVRHSGLPVVISRFVTGALYGKTDLVFSFDHKDTSTETLEVSRIVNSSRVGKIAFCVLSGIGVRLFLSASLPASWLSFVC